MSLPSTVEGLPFFVKTLGAYWMDPRMLVGNGRPYANKEAIPAGELNDGMWTWTTDGKLWVRIADAWVDMFALYQLVSEKNQPGGYAGIDQVTGKIDASLIPSVALTDPQTVDTEAEMLALVAEAGDVAKRTDENGATYMLKTGGDPTVLADWIALSGGLSVDSVNGKTGVVTLNLAEISETATYKRVTQSEKNTWNNKQDSLLYDAVPTFQSTKIVNSGALFDYLKTIQSSVEKKSWPGSDADGFNRFNLDVEDADIDSIIVFSEGGVTQHEGVHFTVDSSKRYIEFNDNPDDNLTYHVTYLSNIPVVSLTSVSVENVEGLLIDGMINPALIASVSTNPTIADAIDHNANGELVVSLATHYQTPVNLTANITSLNLTGGIPPKESKIVITVDDNIRTFAPAPGWIANGESYSAGQTTLIGNRVYKVPAGQSHSSSADFATDLAAGKWKLHIRFADDTLYFPSRDDEDILHIECLGDDYYKITIAYGS